MESGIELPINLAVYGTLKKGYGNHYILKDSQFLKEALLPNMECYMGYTFPMAWYNPNSRKSLKCEIYHITSEDILKRLHKLEGHPTFFKCISHPNPLILESFSGFPQTIWFYQCEGGSDFQYDPYDPNLLDDQIMEWKPR